MLFKQLFDTESCTYTYLIADPDNKEAVLIDPVDTQLDVYLDLLKEHKLTLKYSLETHVHADHVTASGMLRQKLGAKTAVNSLCGADSADTQIQDGDIFEFGANETIKVISTPGHTPGSTSFLWRDRVFTGDALLIDGCGRTDFQGGSAGAQYDSITQRLFTLPDDTIVYPGHDYKGRWISNTAQERRSNSRLAGKTKQEFVDIMHNLNLPKPKLIDMAVPANRYCGIDEELANQAAEQRVEGSDPKRQTSTMEELVNQVRPNITEIAVQKARDIIDNSAVTIVDVREENEFNVGHLDNAILLPRGVLEFKINSVPALADKSAAIIVYCATGKRSALSANTMQNMGYTNVLSIAGGYEAWKQQT
ncbi:sulfur dioxygenase [Bathymodiolus japonicus methanotrophic gill symbiont]|uniref:MBL fold metallo-hydrolase n=1 Tax=Bathymodiolus japonicus methanotrophic gill symbiont TaxID=113269 RepID=UPI001B718CD0|nr:MBL fold metallo-hydrolase [Bathymodiolus japonicus methanotrophic gill symbiont]GFO72076.1 sulfur dioxygenase [Bathymodiolus japonicus methanotrophic gill symbiont]